MAEAAAEAAATARDAEAEAEAEAAVNSKDSKVVMLERYADLMGLPKPGVDATRGRWTQQRQRVVDSLRHTHTPWIGRHLRLCQAIPAKWRVPVARFALAPESLGAWEP
jgi:hypothetical protein